MDEVKIQRAAASPHWRSFGYKSVKQRFTGSSSYFSCNLCQQLSVRLCMVTV